MYHTHRLTLATRQYCFFKIYVSKILPARSHAQQKLALVDNSTLLLDGGFSQEIYQYRSVRRASFLYETLKDDFPKQSVRVGTEPALFPVELPDNHASQYIMEYLYGSPNVSYYIAQYDELIIVVQMPFSGESAPIDDFIKVIQLADERISKLLGS